MRYLPIGLLSLPPASCFMYVEHKEKFTTAVLLKGFASFCFILLGIFSRSLASDDTLFANRIIIGLIPGGIAAGVLLASPSSCSVLFFIGALSFLISDLNTSGPRHQQKLRIVNLSLYYIGQLLIALSLQFLR